MSKMLTVRVDEQIAARMEAVRDPERFPTQADFIREALRRMIREERRNRVRAEMKAMAQDTEAMELGRQWAEAGMEDFVARWEKADRGEL